MGCILDTGSISIYSSLMDFCGGSPFFLGGSSIRFFAVSITRSGNRKRTASSVVISVAGGFTGCGF